MVYFGSRLIRKVEMFMIRMVIRKVYFCLIRLFSELKISVLKGCMMKFVVKVSSVKMLWVVLGNVVKNCVLMIVVSEL